jgi:hypothetical protein
MTLRLAAERLRAERAEAQNRCPVGRLRLTMSDQDRSELDDLLRMSNTDMPSNVILQALKDSGVDLTFDEETPIQAHRRMMRGGSGCKCQA